MSGNQTLDRGNLPVVSQLTPVEAKVWSLLCEGKTYSEIAEDLCMKEKSVRRRLTEIREKVAVQ